MAASNSSAADVRYGVTIGGRPLDSAGHSGLLHDGVTFVNIVRAVQAFSGLLVFSPGGGLRVVVGKHKFEFTVGSREAVLDGTMSVRLRGAPFVLGGDTYVPVSAVATLTGSTVAVDAKHHVLDFEPGADSGGATPAPTPGKTGAPRGSSR